MRNIQKLTHSRTTQIQPYLKHLFNFLSWRRIQDIQKKFNELNASKSSKISNYFMKIRNSFIFLIIKYLNMKRLIKFSYVFESIDE